MNRAYVDTTILVNVLLKRGVAQERCLAALRRFDLAEVPTFALKEMKAGPLYAWAWLHNKCVACQSYSKVHGALSAMARSRRRNLPLTALEAWEEMVRKHTATLGQLTKQYGKDASEDTVNCDRLRLGLRRRISTAWRSRNTTLPVIHPLECYDDSDLVFRSGIIDCRPMECSPTPNCTLALRMSSELDKVSRLRAAIEGAPSKPENARRLKVLRHISRTPKRPITDGMCRSLGDAIFAFFAPPGSVILTTNIIDHKPLAEALGKTSESP